MYSRIKVGLATAVAVALMSVAAVSVANSAETPQNGSQSVSAPNVADRYEHLYEQVDKQNVGPYDGGLAGRDIVTYGVETKNGTRPATKEEIQDANSVMVRMIHPPEPAPVEAAPTTSTTTTTEPTTGSGSYSIPEYIVQCESGGDYSAQNPSGAYGAYQIMPETAAAYGCDLSTPAGQDACAAEIYSDVGTSAWVCG